MSSELPPGAVPPGPGQHWGPPPSGAPIPSAQPPHLPSIALGRAPRWPTFAALAIALIALSVGLAAWFRPLPRNDQTTAKPTYTDQQVASAKASVCNAFGQVSHGLNLADTESANSSDRGAKVAAVALTRQVLDFGSRYLLEKIAEEPATPAALATAVRQQANAYQELLIGYINGAAATDPSLQPSLKASDDAADTIRQLCK
jgi:hypothetical protein